MTQEYWKNKNRNQINYIEITRKRYFNVYSDYKYTCVDNKGEKHYFVARNRKRLDDKLEDGK